MTDKSLEAFEAWSTASHFYIPNDLPYLAWQAGRKALADEIAQAVEPVTDEENERFSQDVSNFEGADPEATKYALDGFLKNRKALADEQAQAVEPVTGKRAELIARLRANGGRLSIDVADMLEADAKWAQVAQAQDAKLRAMVGKPGGIEKLREVLDKARAQQVAAPMTDEQIVAVAKKSVAAEPGRDGYILPISFARAIEAHHGIGAKP